MATIKSPNFLFNIDNIVDADIESAVGILANHHLTNIDYISSDSKLEKSYHLIKWVDQLWVNKSKHKKLDNFINKQYRPSDIKHNSIGSFLFGCYQTDYGDVDHSCSPLCTGKINNTDLCSKQIWIQRSFVNKIYKSLGPDDLVFKGSKTNRFGKIKSNESDEAYIYVDDDFCGFTKHELDYFRQIGLKQAQLLRTKSGKHFTVHSMAKIDDLPTQNNKSTKLDTYDYINNDNNNCIIYVVALFVFFIVVLALIINRK